MIVGNHKPSLRSVDEAMRRRLHLVPFTVTIPSGERDKHCRQLLAERAGNPRLGVGGCLEWQRDGLSPPEAVLAATNDYFEAEDTFERWIDERCERRAALQRELGRPLRQLEGLRAEAGGEYVGSNKRFAETLTSRGFERWRTSQAKGFRGLRLASKARTSTSTRF